MLHIEISTLNNSWYEMHLEHEQVPRSSRMVWMIVLESVTRAEGKTNRMI